MSAVIEWRQGNFSRSGYVGGMKLFGIHWGVRRQEAMWSLSTDLPIGSRLLGQHYAAREDAEAAAARLLAAFVHKLTATALSGPERTADE